MPFLEIKSAAFGYNVPLISNVNASLDLGDICLLVGNNGVGKTTLVKSILGQVPLLKGKISIDGSVAETLSALDLARQVSVVFSKSEASPYYTLKDLISLGRYVYYPYYMSLTDEDEAEIEQIIEKLNLAKYRNHLLSELSDGNLQKAFIGRALAQNTPMIVLDEPTTYLDEENKLIILELLKDLAQKQNKLILFSSHDWRIAKDFSDKLWWIKDEKILSGKIIKSDKSSRLSIDEIIQEEI